MEIEYAFLARAADASPDGSVSVLGLGFETVRLQTFPQSIPLTIVVRLRDVKNRQAPITLEFDATGDDGVSVLDAPFVFPLEPLRLPKNEAASPQGSSNILFSLGLFSLPRPGVYLLSLRLSGESVVTHVFSLTAVQTDA